MPDTPRWVAKVYDTRTTDTLSESTAKFVPLDPLLFGFFTSSTCGKLAARKALKYKRKTELELHITECLFSSFALRFDVILSRRRPRSR